MILGVASIWNERKGLNDFIELSRLLEEETTRQGLNKTQEESKGHEESAHKNNTVLQDNTSNAAYKIVLVGLFDSQIKELSKKAPSILALPRTSSAKELAEIYTAADVFVNPSYEETFGLTTAEAQACGTYSIVYKDTACEEILDYNKGITVDYGSKKHIRLFKECLIYNLYIRHFFLGFLCQI